MTGFCLDLISAGQPMSVDETRYEHGYPIFIPFNGNFAGISTMNVVKLDDFIHQNYTVPNGGLILLASVGCVVSLRFNLFENPESLFVGRYIHPLKNKDFYWKSTKKRKNKSVAQITHVGSNYADVKLF